LESSSPRLFCQAHFSIVEHACTAILAVVSTGVLGLQFDKGETSERRMGHTMRVLPPINSRLFRQRIGALALAAIGLVFIWRSLAELPFGTIDNPGPGITPLALAALLVAAALWSMASASRHFADSADERVADAPAADPGAVRHAVLVVAGIVAAALAFGVIGYRLTVLGLLLFYLGAVERKPPIPVLLVSFGIAFGSYWLFVHVLKVSLPSGPWGL
jgi:hypothetical protein